MPHRRPRRFLAAAVIVVMSSWNASTARAADEIRIDEFNITCVNGFSNAAFVELTAAGPDQVYDDNIRLRFLNSNGSIRYEMPIGVSARAGQSWPQGRRWLIGHTNFYASTQVAADAQMTNVPASSAGAVLLVRLNSSGGAALVLDRVDYTSTGAIPAPTLGRSLQRQADLSWQLKSAPDPTTAGGIVATAASCFLASNQSARVNEFQLLCRNALISGQFIELVSSSVSGTRDPAMRLRTYDRNDALITEITDLFGASSGQPWANGTEWLIGPATLVGPQGQPADRVLPAPLDTVAGRIVFVVPRAEGGETVLSDVRYGTAALARPGYGKSLTYSSGYIESPLPTPKGSNALSYVDPSCERPLPSTAFLSELQLECWDGSNASQFLELGVTGSGELLWPELTLEARDHTGQLIGTITDLFGTKRNSAWSPARRWLVAGAGFRDLQQHQPDLVLPFILDPLGGRVILRDTAAPAGSQTCTDLVYGPGGVPAPAAGRSLEWTGGAFTERLAPAPLGFAGLVYSDASCGRAPIAVAVREVQLRCANGSTTGQFLELGLLGVSETFDPRVNVVLRDNEGNVLSRITQPFATRTGGTWDNSRPWLIANNAYRSTSGAPPDLLLPVDLDTLGGRIELVQVLNGSDLILRALSYGPGGVPMPAFGRVLAASGATFIEAVPTPTGYSLSSYATDVACTMPFMSGVVLDEVQLECSNGSSEGQFLELRSTLAGERFDSRHRVRAYDRDGLLIGEVALATTIAGSAWAQDKSFLIANPVWRNDHGPDLVLPFTLDVLAGRIEWYGPYGVANNALLGTLSYGHPGELPVVPGGSFVRVSGSVYAANATPTPNGQSGATYTAGRCSAPALAQFQVSEIGTGCTSGSGASFIELRSASGAYHDADVTLIARDHLGVEIGRLTSLFGSFNGTSWPTDRRWLLWNTAFASEAGVGPGALPFALDAAGGALVMRQTVFGQLVTVDSVSYGPGQEAPLPAPGMSIARAELNGPFAASYPSPTMLQQVIVGPACFDPQQWPIRVGEFATACSDGGATGQFIELTSTEAGFAYFSTLRVRLYDSAGQLLGESSSPFAGFENAMWPMQGTVLLGRTEFAPCSGLFDSSLPALLDTTAGRIDLVAVVNGFETVVQSLPYGPGTGAPSPTRGRSAERQPDGSYLLSLNPTPKNRAGATVALPACDYLIPPVRIGLFALGCASGHPVGQFIELRSTAPFTIPPSLALQITRSDDTTAEVPIPTAQVGRIWPEGGAMLFTSTLWPTHLGRCWDAFMPTMHATNGTIRLIERAGANCFRVLDEITYGTGRMVTVPAAGVAIRQDSNGALVHEPWPSPTCASGDTTWLVPCLSADPEQTVVVQEFSLMDAAHNRRTQFIELSSSKAGQLWDTRVGIRTYASDGSLIQLIPASALYPFGGLWRPGATRLVVSDLTPLTGQYFDKLLAPLDTLGGRIELVYQPSYGGPLQTFRTLTYGAGGTVAAPGAGYSAQRMPDGTYDSGARPTPANILGAISMANYPIAGCEIASLISSTGENEPVGTPTFDRLQTIAPTRSTFDKTRGTVSSSAGPGMTATTIATDRYVLEAPPGNAVNVIARMRATTSMLCDSSGCAQGTAMYGLILNGVSTSRSVASGGTIVLDLPIVIAAGTPITLGQEVWATQNSGEGFTRRVFADAQLEFVGVPAGMRISSCSGFLQDQPVPVLLALTEAVAAADHARLRWRVDQAADFTARVQRREGDGEWIEIGAVQVNGSGELAFEDRSVLPLHRYGYRLAWTEPARGAVTAGEAWLDIPRALAFALHGARPNPTRGAMTVAFQLAAEGDVRVELIDIAGRRAFEHRADRMAPGDHLLTFARAGEVAPGMYVLRLRQGERSATTRVIVTR